MLQILAFIVVKRFTIEKSQHHNKDMEYNSFGLMEYGGPCTEDKWYWAGKSALHFDAIALQFDAKPFSWLPSFPEEPFDANMADNTSYRALICCTVTRKIRNLT
ncbi:uncharacterized protein LOC127254990 [Andrographis paniculata]|uniref:uncharacterized protein LOC127254990 n=1 Tax=Andrographis paniculata TaxID=175694 RepID=UPI0021E83245|nr:uncharacterized protein LOC127254990 [Andrographis paniculata]